jgi:hypothetical protein
MNGDQMWFAVRVSPQHELLAAQILTCDGHLVCVPLENRWRRLSKRTQNRGWVRVPMLTSYIFLNLVDEALKWQVFRAIKEWSFVHGVIGDPPSTDNPLGTPRPIPDEQIEQIRMKSAELTQKPAKIIDYQPNRSDWVKYRDRNRVGADMQILVEEPRGKEGERFKEFIGRFRGTGMPMVFKVKDVEPV